MIFRGVEGSVFFKNARFFPSGDLITLFMGKKRHFFLALFSEKSALFFLKKARFFPKKAWGVAAAGFIIRISFFFFLFIWTVGARRRRRRCWREELEGL